MEGGAIIRPLSMHLEAPGLPPPLHSTPEEILSRKRRMDFFDLANLLDRDGNLQNEMLVFAFAATMLSTIPVLLGNEFDVNVGLKRKKRDDQLDDYDIYSVYNDVYTPLKHYKYIMTNLTNKETNEDHQRIIIDEKVDINLPVYDLMKNVLNWSEKKTKNQDLTKLLIQLGLDRIMGKKNPTDKLVQSLYKKWYNL